MIGAAWWWHGWQDTDYNQLAGALVAGHIIECSGYGSGANFCDFFRYPLDRFVEIGYPIAEIYADGSSAITKHQGTRGLVCADSIKAQLLYEIQGNIYLHSDSAADLTNVEVVDDGKDRVRVTGTVGMPPPPTTKVAAFYRGGWQCEYTLNATGYASAEKFELHKRQILWRLQDVGELDKYQVLEFQQYGISETNPTSQLRSTTGLRVFGQAKDRDTVATLGKAMLDTLMQHYAGMHGTLDWRLLQPKPYVAYCPCIMEQRLLKEEIHILDKAGNLVLSTDTGHPPAFRDLTPRQDYDTADPIAMATFGSTVNARLGDLVLARSGDKGANLNIGFFVREEDEWDWLRSFLSHGKMTALMADEWDDKYRLERCEFPGIRAVHFVVYGILQRGVSSSARLDALGKGFAEYIRDRWTELPTLFRDRYTNTLPSSHSVRACQ